MPSHYGYPRYASAYGPIGCWSRPELIGRAYCWFRMVPRTFRCELLVVWRGLARAGHAAECFTPVGALPVGMRPFCDHLLGELCVGSGIVYLAGLCGPHEQI